MEDIYRSTCILQVQDCLSISPMAVEDRRRHGEQHVVPLAVVDQHGERQRDVGDSLCLQEWSSAKGWELGWVAKKVVGVFFFRAADREQLDFHNREVQVTLKEYPEENYPTNCHGTFYLFSGKVRTKLLEVKIYRIGLTMVPPFDPIFVKFWPLHIP